MSKQSKRDGADNITYGDVGSVSGGPLSAIVENEREPARRGVRRRGAARARRLQL